MTIRGVSDVSNEKIDCTARISQNHNCRTKKQQSVTPAMRALKLKGRLTQLEHNSEQHDMCALLQVGDLENPKSNNYVGLLTLLAPGRSDADAAIPPPAPCTIKAKKSCGESTL